MDATGHHRRLRALARLGPAYALQPNGRFTDFRTPKLNDSISPGGVMKKSYNDVLYSAGTPAASTRRRAERSARHLQPGRCSPIAASRRQGKCSRWAELTRFHSWMGLTGTSPALIVQNGWTDDPSPPRRPAGLPDVHAARGARLSLQPATSGTRAAGTTSSRATRCSRRPAGSSTSSSRARAGRRARQRAGLHAEV